MIILALIFTVIEGLISVLLNKENYFLSQLEIEFCIGFLSGFLVKNQRTELTPYFFILSELKLDYHLLLDKSWRTLQINCLHGQSLWELFSSNSLIGCGRESLII